jgi:hypothetical protein|tara:strand:- start:1847 stop:2224 length:378 start_codon:yes stop_codon:yes gene_type:complete
MDLHGPHHDAVKSTTTCARARNEWIDRQSRCRASSLASIARDERDRSDGETMNLPSKCTRQIVVARGRSRRIATHRFAGSLNGGEFFRAGDLFHHRSWTARACLSTRRRRPTIAMDRPRAFFYDF